MSLRFEVLEDVLRHGYDDVIDVRSPSEFAIDHVPGALNLPVLSDEERAEVGTIYVQDCAFRARKVGAALVARNAARHIETHLADHDGGWRPLVYCWRGGQRSASFASILSQIGWRAETLEGGYQSFRRLVARALHTEDWPGPVIVLDGNTGTAKTELLGLLDDRGVQVLDLEGLARHRGSVLGALTEDQPSQKAFETGIAMALAAFDPTRPVIVEAESSKVGERLVPSSLWAAMRVAPRIEVTASVAARAAYLAQAYRDLALDVKRMTSMLDKLIPFQGHDRVAEWKVLAKERHFEGLAQELVTHHYDGRYERSRARLDRRVLGTVDGGDLSPAALDSAAEEIARLVR